MRGKAVFVIALAASSLLIGASPGLASGGENSPWFDTNANAAGSRANLKEQVLSRSSVGKAQYLRSVAAPVDPPQALCPGPVGAPVLAAGSLYAITNGQLSKYNPATGGLIWRSVPDPAFSQNYDSLAISGNTVVVGASDCTSASEPPGIVYAFNATTGALAWKTPLPGAGPLDDAVIAGSSIITEGADAAGSEVAVLSPQTGQQQYKLSQAVSVLAVDRSQVYATCGSQGRNLCAYSTGTGALKWQNTPRYSVTLAAEADGVLYLDSGVALSTATGKPITTIWASPNLGPTTTALAVGDGRIAVVTAPRVLYPYSGGRYGPPGRVS